MCIGCQMYQKARTHLADMRSADFAIVCQFLSADSSGLRILNMPDRGSRLTDTESVVEYRPILWQNQLIL